MGEGIVSALSSQNEVDEKGVPTGEAFMLAVVSYPAQVAGGRHQVPALLGNPLRAPDFPHRRLNYSGVKPCGGDPGQGRDLVIVGGVAGDADRADGRPSGPLTITPPATGIRPFGGQMPQGRDEAGPFRRHFPDAAGIDPQRQRAGRLAPGDVQPEEAGAVLALESDHMTARIHHHAGKRLHARVLALGEGGGDDGVGLFQADAEIAHGMVLC